MKLLDLDPRWAGDTLTMQCPCGGDHRCGVRVAPGGWTASSRDLATITLRPSIAVQPCGAHVYVTDGTIVPC